MCVLPSKPTNKQTNMNVINTENVRSAMKLNLSTRRPNEVAICYFHAARDCCWYDANIMQKQAKQWKEQIKKGIVRVDKDNNQTVEMEGKNYYVLVIQSADEDKEDPIDPIGVAYGFLVEGYGYYFTSKKQRDVVYKSLTKGKK